MIDDMSAEPIYVLGAGGHAKVLVATLEAEGVSVGGVLDDDETKWGTDVLGHTVTGPIGRIVDLRARCILAIGDNRVRRQLALQLKDEVEWGTAVHPRAYLHPSVEIGAGTVIFAGAVVQPSTRIGAHVIINTASSIDHDGTIGDYAHVGPGVNLAGDVSIDEGVLMGTGSAAIPGVRVGAWSTVGAGGVVTQDLDPELTAVGVPARPIGRLLSSR